MSSSVGSPRHEAPPRSSDPCQDTIRGWSVVFFDYLTLAYGFDVMPVLMAVDRLLEIRRNIHIVRMSKSVCLAMTMLRV